MIWWDTLFVLDFGFDIFNGVRRFNIKSDSFNSESFDENLHTTNNKAKSQKKCQISETINSNKNNFANSKVDNDTKKFTIDNFNNHSVLKEQFKNTQLKNISINFGISPCSYY